MHAFLSPSKNLKKKKSVFVKNILESIIISEEYKYLCNGIRS